MGDVFVTKMSSRGQVVIPEAVRVALKLKYGTCFKVTVTAGGKVIFEVIK